MKKQNLLYALGLVAVIVLTSITTIGILQLPLKQFAGVKNETEFATPTSFASISNTPGVSTDFTVAAEQSVHSVVHVKTKIKMQQSSNYSIDPFFEYFFGRPEGFGQQPKERMGSGSGVILTSDGYIVTNNHVIDQASEVEVTLDDKRTFTATVIGADASTDIALLKVDATDLIPIRLGNSDNLRVGEWVLAVGNPFNLTSTVTAGIVSAKARNINILNSAMKIESFIQTDAAVNPGNSGGALVNTAGELVGINTAIASQTGSYAGYAFAVPTSIVSKVVADLKEYGVVQRAILGVQIQDIDTKLKEEKKIETLKGAYVAGVGEESAAKAAGIKEGDVLVKVNDIPVGSVAELQEQVGRYRPGDKISIEILRGGKLQTVKVELKNRSGNTDIVKAVDPSVLGGEFKDVTAQTKAKFRIPGGLEVTEVAKNGLLEKVGISKGYIIVKVNQQNIHEQADLDDVYNRAINSASDEEKVLFISGFYQNGKVAHYAIDLK